MNKTITRRISYIFVSSFWHYIVRRITKVATQHFAHHSGTCFGLRWSHHQAISSKNTQRKCYTISHSHTMSELHVAILPVYISTPQLMPLQSWASILSTWKRESWLGAAGWLPNLPTGLSGPVYNNYVADVLQYIVAKLSPRAGTVLRRRYSSVEM